MIQPEAPRQPVTRRPQLKRPVSAPRAPMISNTDCPFHVGVSQVVGWMAIVYCSFGLSGPAQQWPQGGLARAPTAWDSAPLLRSPESGPMTEADAATAEAPDFTSSGVLVLPSTCSQLDSRRSLQNITFTPSIPLFPFLFPILYLTVCNRRICST